MSEIPTEQLFEEARRQLIQDECRLAWFGVADNFDELKLLLDTVDDLIAAEEAKEVERLSQLEAAMPKPDPEFWAMNHPYEWEDIIAQQFRGSFFLTVMAAVEQHVGRMATYAGMIARAPVELDDLKGGFYPRVRKYLERVCGLSVPGGRLWSDIDDLYQVRNLIAHRGFYIGDDAKAQRVRSIAQKRQGLLGPSDHLALTHEFCEEAWRDAREFCVEVWQSLVARCRSIKDQEAAE